MTLSKISLSYYWSCGCLHWSGMGHWLIYHEIYTMELYQCVYGDKNFDTIMLWLEGIPSLLSEECSFLCWPTWRLCNIWNCFKADIMLAFSNANINWYTYFAGLVSYQLKGYFMHVSGKYCTFWFCSHKSKDRLADLVAEHLDHLHYLNDILELNIEPLNNILTDYLLNRLYVPLYVKSLIPKDPIQVIETWSSRCAQLNKPWYGRCAQLNMNMTWCSRWAQLNMNMAWSSKWARSSLTRCSKCARLSVTWCSKCARLNVTWCNKWARSSVTWCNKWAQLNMTWCSRCAWLHMSLAWCSRCALLHMNMV